MYQNLRNLTRFFARKDRIFRVGLAVALVFCLTLLISSCSVTRHIPEERQVVSRVRLEENGITVNDNNLRLAVAQNPYHRTFGILPLSAWIWHNDSTHWWNRMRAKMGTQPPIYDEALAQRSERSMMRALINEGYLDAHVTHDTVNIDRKIRLTYHIDKGRVRKIATLRYMIEDPLVEEIADANPSVPYSLLHIGDPLDRTQLEQERTHLTSFMRDKGFYDFNKDNVSFIVDTIFGSTMVDVTMFVSGIHNQYYINDVEFVTDYDLFSGESQSKETSYLKPSVLAENCYLEAGQLYSEDLVRKTYAAFSRLHILKYVNIRLEPVSGENLLNCKVYLSRQHPQAVLFELDGTNTSGDFGFAAALTYQHRNLFRGSEAYSATVKGGYESLSGNVSGLVNDNYTEYSFQNQIDFPRFLCPFIKTETRRSFAATTAVNAGYSYQTRPEYTRIITQAGLTYKWNSSNNRYHHYFDVLDLSYVYLPKRSESFLNIIQNAGPISYSSYTSHLIMAMGYNLYAGNGGSQSQMHRPSSSRDVWSMRLNPEVGGNALGGISRMVGFKEKEGRYQIFDLPFEQYARFDMDWSYSKFLNDRSRLAFHLAGGIAVPYGNSKVMPFEKRYYSGGANSVRGWSVRTLGPGRYHSKNASTDYFNQCGDVRLDASLELRSKLFWNFELAAFVDAGNVWTLKEYDAQPMGVISENFYKEIAAAWGLGIRLVTDFVVLRLDMGIKAYDPSRQNRDAWVVTDPLSSHNRTLHFAVGYPF